MADKIYFQPKADAEAIQDFYGPKNILPFRLVGKYVYTGLTFTLGSGDVITVNGTSSNEDAYRLTLREIINPGTYKVSSGLNKTGSNTTFYCNLIVMDLSNTKKIHDIVMTDSSVHTFSIDTEAFVYMLLRYKSNITLSNLQIKPFLAFSKVSNVYTVNNNYRQLKRNISDKLTSGELYSTISNGEFNDIHPGNIITGPTTETDYYIGHLDYWYGYSNIGLASTHHVIIFPTKKWLGETGKMNATNTTEGGYWGSTGREEVDALAQQYFVKDFGSHIKPFKNILSTAVKDGATSAWEWKENRYADLMSEAMIHGTTVFANGGHNTGTQKEQLAIFREYGEGPVLGAQYFFNKDVASAASFAYVTNDGLALYNGASYAYGFLPFAVLTG